MHIAIKGTKTVSEYKELYSKLEQWAIDSYLNHRELDAPWSHGEISLVKQESDKVYVQYTDGHAWLYNADCSVYENMR